MDKPDGEAERSLNKYIEGLLQDWYRTELNLKEQIDAHLALPVGILTILATPWFYFAQGMADAVARGSWETLANPMAVLLASGLGASFCAGLVPAVYYLWHAFRSREYTFLPSPRLTLDYVQGIREHYESMSDDNAASRTEDDLRTAQIEALAKATESNIASNVDRLACIHNAKKSILLFAILLFVAAALWAVWETPRTPSRLDTTTPAKGTIVSRDK